jgi:DNA-binding MarR family transcriptional regulator
MAELRDDVSLLFDLFVASNRVRRLIEVFAADAPLRGEEYAVYSVLFDLGPMTATEMRRALGMPLTTVLDHLRVMDSRRHLRRRRHPRDGRARQLVLTEEGLEVHRRTSQIWAPIHRALEEAVAMPVMDVRRALRAIDRAAAGMLAQDDRMTASG